MFGLNDVGVSLAFSLSVLASLLCVVYGLLNWNREGDTEAEEMTEELEWEKKEQAIDETL